MTKKYVIDFKYMGPRAPMIPTIVFWLLLDRLQAAGWVYGMVGTVLTILWIGFFVTIFTTKRVAPVFDVKEEKTAR